MKIALVANTTWYLYNFRRRLMTSLMAAGHQAVAIGGPDAYGARLHEEGFAYRQVSFNQTGTNPLRELGTIRDLRRILLDEKADIVLTWTPKGNSYAALALLGTGVPLIANVSGLGRAFIHQSWVTTVARKLLKFALGRARLVFFQNPDDRETFIALGLVAPSRTDLLPGSGVDLKRFTPHPMPPDDGSRRMLMIGRLLWSKGVAEFIEAARILKRDGGAIWRFQLLGGLDENPVSGVGRDQLDAWLEEGLLEYLGTTDDVRPHIAAADAVVLPSYREGTPRSLLESAAMARPVLTSDVPGCRACVDDGVSGLLFQVRDGVDLARAMARFAALDADARLAMGKAGRAKMEREFDEQIVIDRYIAALQP